MVDRVFRCDYKKGEKDFCGKKPFAEVYPFIKNEEGEWEAEGSWCYLCLKHFLIMRIKAMLGKVKFGWCRVDSSRDTLEHIREELWDLQADIYAIKDRLGIESESLDLDDLEEFVEDENKGYE